MEGSVTKNIQLLVTGFFIVGKTMWNFFKKKAVLSSLSA